MIKVFLLLTIIFGLILGFGLFIQKNTKSQLLINNKKLYIEYAKTNSEKQTGLSKYNKIEDNYGMVFLFDKPDYYSFWMKDMKFAIDIIFIKDNQIVDLYKNLKPPINNLPIEQVTVKTPADKVLEINAGLSDKYNLKIGDKIEIN